ncbi:unnamed protein product [Ilex paraguariensis]|uniref:Uncharacterized protein n=1 Tax=Ilex paraguariensis TaxID=185542 RepID=A0ABC8RRJ7_9AQUA
MEKKYYAQSLPSEKLEFQVFFNDHISNDFNTLFASSLLIDYILALEFPGSFYDWLFLSSSLHILALGIIGEPQVDMFNLPIYSASAKEMTRLIESNGSFSIEKMGLTDPRLKVTPINAQVVIMHVRAAMEGVIAKHFGRDIVDELFECISQKCMEDFHLMESSNMKGTQLFIVL